MIVAGERRFRASLLAGKKTIPAVAREVRHLDTDTRAVLFQALKELAALSLKTLPKTFKEITGEKQL